MRAFRFLLILAASAAIAFALLSAEKHGMSAADGKFMKTYGAAFAGGFLGATAIFLRNKAEKK